MPPAPTSSTATTTSARLRSPEPEPRRSPAADRRTASPTPAPSAARLASPAPAPAPPSAAARLRSPTPPPPAPAPAAVKDDEDALINGDGEGLINFETFDQILELDEEGDYEFSWEMTKAFFAQAKNTFKEMDLALEKKDCDKLSSLGHFLKGSSAALGVIRVQASCEKIQHYGHLRDEEVGIGIKAEDALARIASLMITVKKDFGVAEKWLKNWFTKKRAEVGIVDDDDDDD